MNNKQILAVGMITNKYLNEIARKDKEERNKAITTGGTIGALGGLAHNMSSDDPIPRLGALGLGAGALTGAAAHALLNKSKKRKKR